jgi:hypothetical protein
MSDPASTSPGGFRRTASVVLGGAVVASALLVAVVGAGPVAASGPGSGGVAFTTQPLGASVWSPSPTGQAGVPWSIQPTVTLVGGLDPSFNYQVTLSVSPSSGGSGNLACAGGTTMQMIGGSAAFRGCAIDSPGQGYTLDATVFGTTGLGVVLPPMSTTSLPFNISGGGGIATQISFTTQPLGANLGSARPSAQASHTWSIQPVVAVVDQFGRPIRTDNTTIVQLSITGGSPQTGGPGRLSCTGGTATTVQGGFAAFTGCSIDTPGTAYQLTASTISWGSTQVLFDISLPFDITGGNVPSRVRFNTQPLGAVSGGNTPSSPSGTPWTVQPSVAVLNPLGQIQVNDFLSVVTLSIDPSSPAGGQLFCGSGTSVQVTAGIAFFSGCQIVGPGSGYRLRATAQTISGPIGPATSLPFNITASASALQQQPSAFTINPGDPVTITTTLVGPGNAGQVITFQGTNALHKEWTTFGTGTTNASGVATITVTPTFSATVRSVFAGSGTLAPATSEPDVVAVRAAVAIAPGGTNTVARNTTVTYTATLKPDPGQGQRVQFLIYRLVNGVWTFNNQRTFFTNGASQVTLTWRWATAGRWYVRAFAASNAYYSQGFSPTSVVNVR